MVNVIGHTCWGSLDPCAAAAVAASGEGEGTWGESSEPSSAKAEAMTGPAAIAHSPGREAQRLAPNWELKAYKGGGGKQGDGEGDGEGTTVKGG